MLQSFFLPSSIFFVVHYYCQLLIKNREQNFKAQTFMKIIFYRSCLVPGLQSKQARLATVAG